MLFCLTNKHTQRQTDRQTDKQREKHVFECNFSLVLFKSRADTRFFTRANRFMRSFSNKKMWFKILRDLNSAFIVWKVNNTILSESEIKTIQTWKSKSKLFLCCSLIRDRPNNIFLPKNICLIIFCLTTNNHLR
jgi:hypothetical protein